MFPRTDQKYAANDMNVMNVDVGWALGEVFVWERRLFGSYLPLEEMEKKGQYQVRKAKKHLTKKNRTKQAANILYHFTSPFLMTRSACNLSKILCL